MISLFPGLLRLNRILPLENRSITAHKAFISFSHVATRQANASALYWWKWVPDISDSSSSVFGSEVLQCHILNVVSDVGNVR
jgi:hypothetical protein